MTGSLNAGDRLPSTRALATALGVSRTVTSAAYDQLLAEGWVAGRRGAGTFVVAVPTAGAVPAARSAVAPAAPTSIDLRPGVPCLAVLDRGAWRRAWRAAADEPPGRRAGPGRAGGLPFRCRRAPPAPSRPARRARGGARQLGHDCWRRRAGPHLARGAPVAVEEPGYQRAGEAFRAAGLTVLPAPVDRDGLVVDALPDGVAAVFCTPRPISTRWALDCRRSAGSRWSAGRAPMAFVLEDDYDGELRYDVAPLPLLAALARTSSSTSGRPARSSRRPSAPAGWWRHRTSARRYSRCGRGRERVLRSPGSGSSPPSPPTATSRGTCVGCAANWPTVGI